MAKPVYEIPVNGDGALPFPPSGALPPTGFPPPGAQFPSSDDFPTASFPSAADYPPPGPAGAYPPSGGAASYPPPGGAASFPAPAGSAASFPPPGGAAAYPPPGAGMQFSTVGPPAFAAGPETTAEDPAVRQFRESVDPELVAALNEVLLTGASDLHVTSGAAPMLRVDGGLRPLEGGYVWDRERVTRALMSILTPRQRATFEEELELDLAYTVSASARFRVNLYQERGAVGGAFRLIPTEVRSLQELGIPDVVAKFATLPRGLVLVTGPTGSGKSTTLAALIDLVNRTRSDHIVTVEDPIEFLHKHQKSLVNQREVGADTHSFAAALKHVLRQDPDVILIGELRDLETISVALTAAETGHLVFATLHTQDAPQTIDRVIDVFPPHQQGQVRAQLATTLNGVVCQTLVKRISGRGRAVATEVLMATPAIANLIREGKTHQIPSVMQAGRELGMHTMDQHLAELVNSGQISHGAAIEKVHDLEGFKRLVHRTEGPGSSLGSFGQADYGDEYSGVSR
ncbi:hypothetical protein BH09ACT3_BH09ACT3_06790 [soil metagenome]